jgi:hypothetical protein
MMSVVRYVCSGICSVAGLVTFRVAIIGALLLVVAATTPLMAQGDWSGWNAVRGNADIEYRWRATACLANGCGKDVQFRNNSKETVAFDYTIWSEGMQDKGEEVKDTGSTTVLAQSSSNVVALSGGPRITRVYVERKK